MRPVQKFMSHGGYVGITAEPNEPVKVHISGNGDDGSPVARMEADEAVDVGLAILRAAIASVPPDERASVEALLADVDRAMTATLKLDHV